MNNPHLHHEPPYRLLQAWLADVLVACFSGSQWRIVDYGNVRYTVSEFPLRRGVTRSHSLASPAVGLAPTIGGLGNCASSGAAQAVSGADPTGRTRVAPLSSLDRDPPIRYREGRPVCMRPIPGTDMALTVGSWQIADARVQGVTLRPLIGGYELVFGLDLAINAFRDVCGELPSPGLGLLSGRAKANYRFWDSLDPRDHQKSSADLSVLERHQVFTCICMQGSSPRWRRFAERAI